MKRELFKVGFQKFRAKIYQVFLQKQMKNQLNS